MRASSRRIGASITVTSGAIAAIVLLGGAFPAQAGNKKAKGQTPVLPPLTAVEEEQVRTDLVTTATMLLETATARADAQAQALAARALALAGSLPADDLRVFRSGLTELALLREKCVLLRNSVLASSGGSGGAGLTQSSGFPGAPYSSTCGSVRNDTGIVFAAQIALQAAELVWSAASRACDQVAVVAGVGGNTSLACIVADAVLFAAKAVLDDFKFCDEDIDSAEIKGSYDRAEHLHTDLETVDGKVDALGTQIGNIEAAILALQASVEGLRTANCDIIRLLHTPQGQRQSSLPVCAGSPAFPYDWPENN
ncbi:MAG: hypothetical protein L0323_12730 [Planctomycetes bacterium]|nr:hypothetical protein [Planctomycetota bacterium]